jgi:molybdopterin-guanine dinucleotide biosynthesis protein A
MQRIVILAGGLSRRFHGNKLLSKVNGYRTIERVYNVAKSVCKDIYISVNNMEQLAIYSEVLNIDPKYFILDSKDMPANPLNAFLTTIFQHNFKDTLFIPGDIPYIDATSLKIISRQLEKKTRCLSTLTWSNGWMENMWIYYRDGFSPDLYDLYLSLNRKYLYTRRPSDIIRIAPNAKLYPIKDLPVDPLVFTSINSIDDLISPSIRGELTGPITRPILYRYRSQESNPLYLVLKAVSDGDVDSAIRFLYREIKIHIKKNSLQLALHASRDLSELILLG